MDFISARTKEEALDCLHDRGEHTSIIAGGTDVMVQLAQGQLSPKALLHVERLTEFAEIRNGTFINIGSMVTQRQLAEDDLIATELPSLTHAAALCGGWQTQSVGTIGGNVCNASPAADIVPVLMAHDAVVTLESKARGERRLPVSEFVVERRKVAREKDELVTSFDIPRPSTGSGCAFAKVGRRSAMEISIINVAIRIELASDETVADIAIAAGSAGPRPFRAGEAEDLLRSRHIFDLPIKEAAERLTLQATPIDDVRGSQIYRQNVLPRLFERTLNEAAAKALRKLEG